MLALLLILLAGHLEPRQLGAKRYRSSDEEIERNRRENELQRLRDESARLIALGIDK